MALKSRPARGSENGRRLARIRAMCSGSLPVQPSVSFRVLNAYCPCSRARPRKTQHRLQLVSPHNGAVIGVRTDAFSRPSYD